MVSLRDVIIALALGSTSAFTPLYRVTYECTCALISDPLGLLIVAVPTPSANIRYNRI